MKVHTSQFKENVKEFARELDSIITYELNGETIELGGDKLNSITPVVRGSILKSIMKELDIDSNEDIPLNTEINFQFGVKVGDSYEYLDYGNYIVYKSEKQEDTSSYKIICYDKMLYAMKDYESLGVTYPITIKNYIGAICSKLGLVFANENDIFANYNKEIASELYLDTGGNSLGYTFRDVLDELAQVTASTICINDDDELEIRYITNTNDTITEEYFKNVNVTFGEKYGPVNSIVLSRAGGSDNVYLRDEQSVEDNGLCEIKISDNQIMNFNDRSTYLPDILNKLNGLEYYLNDYSSVGICYYEVCDRYNVQIGENTYSCVMFNDEINITQGLEENIYTELPEEGETDYTKADKTDRKINQTYLIVDKQNQTIESVVNQTIDTGNPDSTVNKVSRLTQKVDTLESEISNVTGMVTTKDSTSGTITFTDDTTASEPITIKVYPTNESISYLYPRSNLYPSSTTYLTNRKIRFYNNTTQEVAYDYELPDDLLYYDSEHYDEFYMDLKSQTCQVTKRCQYNADGSVSLLASERIDDYSEDYPTIPLTEGNYTVSILGYNAGYILASLMAKNIYTDQFYTKVETDTKINQTAENITLEANAKFTTLQGEIDQNTSRIVVNSNGITSLSSSKVGNNEIISKINQTPEQITINANKLNLQGYITASDLSGSGTTTINGSNITTGTINGNNVSVTNINASNITSGTISADKINGGTITASAFNLGNGNFSSTTNGTINAKSGKIGAWNLSSSYLAGSGGGYEVRLGTEYLSAKAPGDTWEYLRWYDLVNELSDINVKKDVLYLNDKYDEFYKNLKPVSFKYKNEYEPRTENTIHFGFIAQDIERNIKDCNLNGLSLLYGDKLLKINKAEIIALNTWQIQKLKEEVKEQQKIIEDLQGRIEKLERESDK